MDLSRAIGKFVGGAIVSALIAVGGVWFVVDVSLRGLEASIDVTNRRIESTERNLIDRINAAESNLKEKLLSIETTINQQFDITRNDIKKASLIEPIIRDSSGEEISVALRANYRPLEAIVSNDPSLSAWAAKLQVSLPQGDNQGFFYTFAPSEKWKWANDIDIGKMPLAELREAARLGFSKADPMIANGCVSRTIKNDGSFQLVPVKNNSLAGRDGIICLVDSADEAQAYIKQIQDFK